MQLYVSISTNLQQLIVQQQQLNRSLNQISESELSVYKSKINAE